MLGPRRPVSLRIQMVEKFVKAVSKPSRPDMNPIRYGLSTLVTLSLSFYLSPSLLSSPLSLPLFPSLFLPFPTLSPSLSLSLHPHSLPLSLLSLSLSLSLRPSLPLFPSLSLPTLSLSLSPPPLSDLFIWAECSVCSHVFPLSGWRRCTGWRRWRRSLSGNCLTSGVTWCIRWRCDV